MGAKTLPEIYTQSNVYETSFIKFMLFFKILWEVQRLTTKKLQASPDHTFPVLEEALSYV